MSPRLRRFIEDNQFVTRVPESPGAGEFRQTRQKWLTPAISIENVRIDNPVPYDFEVQSPCPFIILIDAVRRDGETKLDTLPPSRETEALKKLILAPPQCAMTGWSTTSGQPIRVTVVHFDPAAAPIADLARSRDAAIRPILHFSNDALRSTVEKLGLAAANPDYQSLAYGEHLASLLLLELNYVNCPGFPLVAVATGGLTPKTANIVRDYIDAHLHEDISPASLAALVNLSPFHFARAFKATFGLPPYQFLMKRRIDRAQRLLVDTNDPIRDIARACGFAGITQFGRTFRKLCKESPREWRRLRE